MGVRCPCVLQIQRWAAAVFGVVLPDSPELSGGNQRLARFALCSPYARNIGNGEKGGKIETIASWL
ncbi:hypothetical protein GCM10009080_30060 [Cupriavidus pauculus]